MNLDVAFLDSKDWAEGMPERLQWLRKNDPVYWSERDQLWIVTRYRDVEYVSKHQELFTSDQGVVFENPRPETPLKIGMVDDPANLHIPLRKRLSRGFTPRMVARLEVTFQKLVEEAIDSVAGKEEFDFVASIAAPLPISLIAEIVGIPQVDRAQFRRWSDDLIASIGAAGDPEIMAQAVVAYTEFTEYITAIIEERRLQPREDLVTILTQASADGMLSDTHRDAYMGTAPAEEAEALEPQELIGMLVFLTVAGNETTRSALAGGMQLLIENPEEREKLIQDPELIPDAVEEIVRLTSPVITFGRTATQDTELGGVEIAKGDQILIVFASANRDEDQFANPDAFQVERAPSHLGFGLGSHFCLGSSLARMELRVAFQHLLRELPRLEFSRGGPVLLPAAGVRNFSEMHVRVPSAS